MRTLTRFTRSVLLASGMLAAPVAFAIPGDTIYETCPDIDRVGDNVACYPLQFTAKTKLHPTDGIPIIAYLFVNTDRLAAQPNQPQPAIVMAHGSGSMFSSGNHNKGLNTKHRQWIKQYTSELGIPTIHVSSFQSRYLLPDTDGDQRMFDWENPPAPDTMGGDDYRATSTVGGQEEGDTFVNVLFDPNADDWKDQSNGRGGVSEVIERPYDMYAAYDFLVGDLVGTLRDNARGETLAAGFTSGTTDTIGNLVPGLVIDPHAVAQYGTSHGGQTAMGTAEVTVALDAGNPMGLGGPNDDGHRFAAYFDYYGGCSVYGAWGGTSNSTWAPHAPFFMLHGEKDPIWTDGATGDTLHEQYHNGECGKRINSARATPGFDVFLESVMYKDAEHSFDGVVVGDIGSSGKDDRDYPSWLGKAHSNYKIVLPALRAFQAIATDPSLELAGFGFHAGNPWFATFPFDPKDAPEATFITRSWAPDPVVPLNGSMANGNIDVGALITDPYDYHPVTYLLLGAAADISMDAFGLMTTSFSGTAPASTEFVIIATSEMGQSLFPVTLTSDGTNGELDFNPGISASPATFVLGDGSAVEFRLDQLVGGSSLSEMPNITASNLPDGTSIAADGATLVGSIDTSTLPVTSSISVTLDGVTVTASIRFSLDANGMVQVQVSEVQDIDTGDGPMDTGLEPLNPPDNADDTVAWSAGTATVAENAGSLTLSLTRSGDGGGAISATWSTAIDTANSEDFTDASGTVEWADGDTAVKTVSIDILDDDIAETEETFNVSLNSITGGVIGNPQLIVVTIEDDDATPGNQAPTANAGSDRTVTAGDAVSIDPAGSSDPDGDELSYQWLQTAGPSVTINVNASGVASFTAPEVSTTETITLQLTVNDGNGGSDTDQVTITVNPHNEPGNHAPVADAGSDQTVNEGATVTLDASGSSDADGDSLGFSWNQVSGPTVTLSSTTTAETSFTAPDVSTSTVLGFTVTVSDGNGSSHSDTVSVTVNPSNNDGDSGGGKKGGGPLGGLLLVTLGLLGLRGVRRRNS